MDELEPHQPSLTASDMENLSRYWGWLLALGILTLILGSAALILPVIATLTVELLIGSLLLIDGVLQTMNYFQLKKKKGYGWRLIGALLAIAVGLLLLLFPFEGILSLTLVVGAFFVAAGIIKGFLAYELRPGDSWGWLLFSAIISVILGVMVLGLWPEASGWILGILVGVDLIIAGWWLILLSLSARKSRSAIS